MSSPRRASPPSLPAAARPRRAPSLGPRLGLWAGLTAALLAGCNAGRGGGDDPADLRGGPAEPARDLSAAPPPIVAHLKGRVLAPEGTIPIAGALVYATGTSPAAIPDETYCDRCVKVPDGTPFTRSGADGSFDLPMSSRGSVYFVVQKGAFRRVRTLEVLGGDQAVDKALTTFPAKMDKEHGDDIPRMAVVAGAWDKIEVSLAKLGLAKLGGLGQIDKATASFDIYERALFPKPGDPRNPDKLLKDPAVLSKYHVVFIPCSGSDGTTCNDDTSGDATVQRNLRDFVARGGKLYVTDYSYDFVRQLFPGYLDWVRQTNRIGSACLPDSYDAPADVQDAGMKDWLAAQGIKDFELKENWTAIERVNTVDTTDLDGKPAKETPKVWVKGRTPHGDLPLTVSFVRSCGRVLFSTYHTEAGAGGMGLLPQEKALLYVLLESAVCVEPPVIQ